MATNRIGNTIKLLRVSKDLSIVELGEQLKVTAQTIRNWEKGRNDPTVNALLEMCKIFGVTFSAFEIDNELKLQRKE